MPETNIGTRIEQIINKLGITKTAFAEKLKVTPAYVSKLVSQKGQPSERLIEDICEKFMVNESFLRDGIGEPFLSSPEEDEYFKAATLISKNNDERAIKAVIEYWKLDQESKNAVWDFIDKLAKKHED